MVANTLIVIVSFVLVLSVIVFIHELGHYGMAKLFGTRVERFSVGFGKPIARFTARSGEDWVIGRWPLGGYVKFLGDSSVASAPDADELARISEFEDPDSLYQNKPVGQRALIALAGPLANFALAIFIFAALGLLLGERSLLPRITEVMPDGAAAQAGLQAGDTVLSVDGRPVETASDLQAYVALRSGETIDMRVERGSREVALDIVPRRVAREDAIGGRAEIGTIGVMLGGAEAVVETRYGPLEALGHGVRRVGDSIAMTGTYAKRILTGKEDGSQFGGVLRIAAITGKVAVDGASLPEVTLGQKLAATSLSLLQLGAMLSVGLGIANLLPIPMLDGGHLLFYGYEAVAGKPVSAHAQEMSYRFGIVVLLGLFAYLTFNDVGYIRSLLS